MNAWAPLTVAIPLLTAAVLGALNRHLTERAASAVALAAAFFSGLGAALLFVAARHQRVIVWMAGWQPRAHPAGAAVPVALGIDFAVGPIGAGMALLAAILVCGALVFSLRYFDTVGTLYQVLMLVFLSALCGFSLTGDLFNLFVWFELMGATGVALCGYESEEAGPIQGALNFGVCNTVAAYLILLGIALVYGRTGALNLAQIGASLAQRGACDGLVTVALALIACGFFTKAAIVPFHFWLADAHAVAPTPVCVLFSGIMVEIALYAALRVYWTVFAPVVGDHTGAVRTVFVLAGVVTAVLGGWMCVQQHQLKRLLAFSTISHMGLVLVGLGLLTAAGTAGAMEYLLGHGLAKAALFLGAGVVLHETGTVDCAQLRGRGRELGGWRGATLATIAALGLAELPPWGTFWGADGILREASRLHWGWVRFVFDFAGLFTAGAVMTVVAKIYWTRTPAEVRHRRIPRVMGAPILAFEVVGLGYAYWPGLRAGIAIGSRAFTHIVGAGGYQAAVLGHQAARLAATAASRPGFGGWLHALALSGAAAIWGAALLGRGAVGATRWGWLRRLHSGHLGDYVAWMTLGCVVITLALARSLV